MNTQHFFKFVAERQTIWRRRQKSPFPWTQDPILLQHRFSNIFRELDKTSIWIRINWREPYATHRMLPFALALARRLNWPPTLMELGFPKRWNPVKFYDDMRNRKSRGEKLVTGAHQVSRGTGKKGGTADFILQTAECLSTLNDLSNKWVGDGLEDTYLNLMKLPGFAHFTSYELVTELTHTKWLCNASDLNTWCVIKEGSFRGLGRVMGRDVSPSGKWLQRGRGAVGNSLEECRELLKMTRSALGKKDKMFKTMTLRNIEDALCEFDKYCRALESSKAVKIFRPDVDRPWSNT